MVFRMQAFTDQVLPATRPRRHSPGGFREKPGMYALPPKADYGGERYVR